MPGRNSASHHPSMGLSIMKNSKSCLVWTAVLLTAVCARAQDPVEWSAHGPAKALNRSERFSVAVTAVIAAGWHIYSFTQPAGGPITSQATVPANQPFSAAGAINGPPPDKAHDPNFEMETETYQGSIDFTMPIVVRPNAPPGTQNVAIDFRFQTCSETTCMPPKTVHLSAPVKITAVAKTAVVDAPKPAATVAPSIKPLVSTAPPPSVLPALSTATTAGRKTNASSGPNTQSLWSFIWLAAAMGGSRLNKSDASGHKSDKCPCCRLFDHLVQALSSVSTFAFWHKARTLAVQSAFGSGWAGAHRTGPASFVFNLRQD